MATTAALVYAGHNRLRYLITSTSTGADSVTITTTGGATPDVLTDSLAGPIKNIANAFANGYGQLAAGALTQAKARALWLSDDPTNLVTVNGQMPISALCQITQRDVTNDPDVSVDANVDGGGHPTIIVATNNPCTAYLDIFGPNTIGA